MRKKEFEKRKQLENKVKELEKKIKQFTQIKNNSSSTNIQETINLDLNEGDAE